MIKLGNVEFKDEKEIKKDYVKGNRYIVQYRSIYQLDYSKNAGFYARKIYYENGNMPLTKRGRYFMFNAEDVNHLVGRNFVLD